MDNHLPHNFSATIEINGQQIQFDFNTMNIKELRLFQVYFTWGDERTKRRFHMQTNKEGNFKITDAYRLPDQIVQTEQALAQAILKDHQAS